MYIPLHCAHKLYHRIGYNLQITDNKLSTYETTTLPSEHSTPNQLQGSTKASSSTQFDKAPKESLIIFCLNFKRALPGHTHTQTMSQHLSSKYPQDSTNSKFHHYQSSTFFIQRTTQTQVVKQENNYHKAKSYRKILQPNEFPILVYSYCKKNLGWSLIVQGSKV